MSGLPQMQVASTSTLKLPQSLGMTREDLVLNLEQMRAHLTLRAFATNTVSPSRVDSQKVSQARTRPDEGN